MANHEHDGPWVKDCPACQYVDGQWKRQLRQQLDYSRDLGEVATHARALLDGGGDEAVHHLTRALDRVE